MLRKFKKDIFREPRRGLGRSAGMRFGAFQVMVGYVVFALYLFGPPENSRPFYVSFEVLLGLTFLLQGSAELLPVDRRRIAGELRLASIATASFTILTAILRLMG